jgi:hypothetical protein
VAAAVFFYLMLVDVNCLNLGLAMVHGFRGCLVRGLFGLWLNVPHFD